MSRAAAAVLALSAGCLAVPSIGQPKCAQNSDCPLAGEVCQEGLCWGAPPTGMFAAVLGPPAARADLVETEAPQLAIGSDGWIDGLVVDNPVAISGRVEYCPSTNQCDHASIAAAIEITRPSRIPGGPPVSINVAAAANAAPAADAFRVLVPRTAPTDPPYTIRVVPDPAGRALDMPLPGATIAQLVPPMRVQLAAPTDTTHHFTISGQLATLAGTITDSIGTPQRKFRVTALGRWEPGGPLEDVSTIGWATDGRFAIAISPGYTGPIEIVARPYDATMPAPTLRMTLKAPDTSSHALVLPANVGGGVGVTVPVVGQTGAGELAPVAGAIVVVHAEVDAQAGVGNAPGLRATYEARATTDANGLATVTLLDGAAFASTYKLDIIPPANSSLGVVYEQPFTTGDTGKVQRLPSRVGLRAVVVDSHGQPVPNVAVRATPSLRFKWSVDAATLPFLDGGIPAATAVTSAAGDFVLWVDPYIGATWGYYDLDLDPPRTAGLPRWTKTEIAIPRMQNLVSLSIDDIVLPEAAYVHGAITDPVGGLVDGGELGVFQIVTDTTPCVALGRSADQCAIPARLVGHATADGHGIVRLALPRP